MNVIKPVLVSALLSVAAGAASANVINVDCEAFIIGISQDIYDAALERADAPEEAEENICEAANQLDWGGTPRQHQVLIEPYGVSTNVVIFPRRN